MWCAQEAVPRKAISTPKFTGVLLHYLGLTSFTEKTLLMSTAKRPGAQIFRFTRVKLKIYPPQ